MDVALHVDNIVAWETEGGEGVTGIMGRRVVVKLNRDRRRIKSEVVRQLEPQVGQYRVPSWDIYSVLYSFICHKQAQESKQSFIKLFYLE